MYLYLIIYIYIYPDGVVEYMEFPGILKKYHVQNLGVTENKRNF